MIGGDYDGPGPNLCSICGAYDGRAGICFGFNIVDYAPLFGIVVPASYLQVRDSNKQRLMECENCRDTRKDRTTFTIHGNLIRTPLELARTGALLDGKIVAPQMLRKWVLKVDEGKGLETCYFYLDKEDGPIKYLGPYNTIGLCKITLHDIESKLVPETLVEVTV